MIANASVTSKTVVSAPDLLWTNPSPNAGFDAQTITLTTGYSAFLVEFTVNRYQLPDTPPATMYIPFSETQRAVFVNISRYAAGGSEYRRIVAARDGQIQFGLTRNDETVYMIPQKIWGLKYTL